MPGFTEQVRAAAWHALARPGADDTYADGDDSTWMEVDWPALTRTVEVLGRRVNVVDTGPPSAATPPTPQTPPTAAATPTTATTVTTPNRAPTAATASPAATPNRALTAATASPAATPNAAATPTAATIPNPATTPNPVATPTPATTTAAGDPPILFIHGLSGAWQNWLLNIPALMRSHRVIAPDLPGFGRSEMPAGRISIQGFARVMDALCDALDIEAPIVVGNSMGGFIGAELTLAFPTRVSKLVLISAAGLSVEHLKREPLLAAGRLMAVGTARTGVKSLPMVTRPRLRRAALQLVVRYPERISVPLASELVAGAGTDGFVGGLDAILGYKFRDRLPEIDVPVLIVWGRNDILIPVRDAHEYERLIGANAHAVVFEDTGHLAMLERPSRFNKLLTEFIAGHHRPEDEIPGVSG